MKRHSIALAFVVVALAPAAHAAGLININTADSVTLQALPGIGTTLAQRIIDGRPYATVQDISNVQGIGDPGSSSYNKIINLITVGDGSQTQTQTQDTQSPTSAPTTTQTDTAPAQTEAQSGTPAVPAITAQLTTDASAVVGAGTLFEGASFGSEGAPLSGARYMWNFGDGAVAEGQSVWHTYGYPGTYDVELSVASNYSSATARALVTAVAAQVGLVAEGDGSLTVTNGSDYDLNIGSWSVRQGQSLFVIPDGTMVLRGKGVRFASTVLQFKGDQSAALYYQNGTKAADATVGAQSPLRGQVVDVSTSAQSPVQKSSGVLGSTDTDSGATGAGSRTLRQTSAQGAGPTSTMNGDLAAAAAAADAGDIGWVYWLALAGIIAVGAVGSYYAYVPQGEPVTADPADEFDIE